LFKNSGLEKCQNFYSGGVDYVGLGGL